MAVFKRVLQPSLIEAAHQLPVVLLTGPRQSGKTTLVRHCFSDKPYVNLEAVDDREYATEDPRGFLAQFPQGAILDEVQHTPELLSYLQVLVDENPTSGQFILTGSENLTLSQAAAQSLAGRVAIRYLMPLSYDELQQFPNAPNTLWETVWSGSYPRPFQSDISPADWLQDYISTYVERDVRRLAAIGDLSTFQTFMRLVAGRTGQEINLSRLGNDTGVSHNTISHWLSLLEAGFLIWRLPPWFANYNARWVKTPKLHFVDSGLVCALLGIREPDQLAFHPLRGPIFETWAAAEIMKHRLHHNLPARNIYHLRQTRGLEVDILIENGSTLTAVEVKSGQTLSSSFFKTLPALARQLDEKQTGHKPPDLRLVYGGDKSQVRRDIDVIPWNRLADFSW